MSACILWEAGAKTGLDILRNWFRKCLNGIKGTEEEESRKSFRLQCRSLKKIFEGRGLGQSSDCRTVWESQLGRWGVPRQRLFVGGDLSRAGVAQSFLSCLVIGWEQARHTRPRRGHSCQGRLKVQQHGPFLAAPCEYILRDRSPQCSLRVL